MACLEVIQAISIFTTLINGYIFANFFSIRHSEYNDRFPSYRCRTMHRLTRQVVASSSAKVRINGKLKIGAPLAWFESPFSAHYGFCRDILLLLTIRWWISLCLILLSVSSSHSSSAWSSLPKFFFFLFYAHVSVWCSKLCALIFWKSVMTFCARIVHMNVAQWNFICIA